MWPFSTVTEPKRFNKANACSPSSVTTPRWGTRPREGDVGERHERGAAGQPCDIVFEPVQLLGAEATQARRLEVQDVDQPDKMHTLIVEALPAVPHGPFAVAVQKLLPPIGKDVMLAGHVKDLAALDLFKGLREGIEGARFLAMGEVPGVEGPARLGAR